MNDASFSRRNSVGSLVDWSMITSKNPVFHIRLRGCRLVGLREKPRKFRWFSLAYAHSSRDDLVSELQVGNPDITFPLRYVDTMDDVAIFFSKSKCLLPSRTTFMSPRV
ncbi:hypothetical protein TNCV_1819891 [Trichonephila clavipes]|nr:hypothetical protein TNCV_1819891 [Trichonephila clavipes]